MRPIRLEIQAFESYLEKTVVDFDKLGTKGLYLIDGATGAGKTTLFQAIYYALYGDTLGGGSKNTGTIETTNEDLRNNKAPLDKDTYVDLIFEEKNSIYHIHREPNQNKLSKRKTDKGYIEAKAFVQFSSVISLGEENEILDEKSLGSNIGDVNKKVEQLLGLDADQFEKTILIPQGKFVEVLSQNTDKRTEIFRSLFDTQGYYNFVNILAKKANDAQSGLKEELQKQNQIFSNVKVNDEDFETKELFEKYKTNSSMEEKIEFLKTLIEKYAKEKESAKEKDDELNQKLQELFAIKQEYTTYESNKKNLDAIQKYIDDNDPILSEKKDQLKELKGQDSTFASYAKESNELSSKLQSYDDLKADEKSLASYKAELSKTQSEISSNEEKIKKLESDLSSFEKELSSINGDPDAELVELADQCTPKISKLNSLKENATNDISVIKAKKTNLDEVVSEKKELSGKVSESLKEYSEISQRYFEDLAGELASNLKDGDPCPVCGSKAHPNKAVKSDDGVTKKMVDSAQKNHLDIKSKFDKNQEKEENISKDLESAIDKALKDLKDYGATNESDLQEALQRLNDDLSTTQKEYDSKKGELTALSKRKKDLASKIEEKKKDKPSLDSSLAESREKLAGCKSKIEGLEENIKRIRDSLKFPTKDEAKARIKELDKLCEDHKNEINTITEDINSLSFNLSNKKGQMESLKSSVEQFESKTHPNKESIDQDYASTSKEEKKYKDAHVNYSTLEKTNQSTLKDLNDSIDSIKDLQRDADRLNHLSTTFGGKGGSDNSKSTIEIYVQGKQLDRVLAYANKRLLAMTDNQFSMCRANHAYDKVSKSGLDIDIVDNQNMTSQGNRKVVTLSGGESFKAALSLSLGLRDAVSAHKGGAKIDCMYIDEGFGTLDSDSLDKVIDILMQQTVDEGNCLVGVISHVEELQSKIPNKIVVFKDSDGNSKLNIIVPNK